MNRKIRPLILFLIIFISAISVSTAESAGRSSVGILSGYGLPVGWWADRWDQSINSELNLRIEVAPGTGIIMSAGLGKSFITDLSVDEILSGSRLKEVPEEFLPYADIAVASQSGSFKQIPIGFGFYFERLIGNIRRLRGYGSSSMMVHIWKVNRSQTLIGEISGPNMTTMRPEDSWFDEKDGVDLGAQVSLGILYQMRQFLYFDLSVAYHYVDIGLKNGAIAYYGQPARTWDRDKLETAESRMDFVQLRLGFRFGQ